MMLLLSESMSAVAMAVQGRLGGDVDVLRTIRDSSPSRNAWSRRPGRVRNGRDDRLVTDMDDLLYRVRSIEKGNTLGALSSAILAFG